MKFQLTFTSILYLAAIFILHMYDVLNIPCLAVILLFINAYAVFKLHSQIFNI